MVKSICKESILKKILNGIFSFTGYDSFFNKKKKITIKDP